MKLKKSISNYVYFLKVVASNCQGYTYATLVTSVLASLCGPISVLTTKYTISSVSEKANFLNIILCLTAVAMLNIIIISITSFLSNTLIPRYAQKISVCLHIKVFERAATVNLKKYEDSSFYNEYMLALQQTDGRAASTISTFSGVLSSVVSIFALVTIIITIKPTLIILSLLSAMVMLVGGLMLSEKKVQYLEIETPVSRKLDYIQRVFYLKTFAQELRIYSCKRLLFKKYGDAAEKMDGILRDKGIELSNISLFCGILSSIIDLLSVLYAAWLVTNGQIGVAGFVAALSSVQQISSNISLFAESIKGVLENGNYIEKYRCFVECKENEVQKTLTSEERSSLSIILCDVSFAYTTEKIIDHISCIIHPGTKVAIIGSNGAGKSTLAKIIAGLLLPDEGKVEYISRRQTYVPQALQQYVAYVSQEYPYLATSIAENVLMHPFDGEQSDIETVNTALEFVGLLEKVMKLPKGIYTELTQEFDESGVSFSGGELQRLAIARAYVKKAPILIFDEMTSAQDLLSTHELVQKVNSLWYKPTVIWITHEMSIVQEVDCVYYIENGQMVKK